MPFDRNERPRTKIPRGAQKRAVRLVVRELLVSFQINLLKTKIIFGRDSAIKQFSELDRWIPAQAVDGFSSNRPIGIRENFYVLR